MSSVTVLPFIGGEMGSFDPSDSDAIETTSTVSGNTPWNAMFSRCAIKCGSNASFITTPTWTQAGTFWFHGYAYSDQTASFGSGYHVIQFFDGATEILRVDHSYSVNPNIVTYTFYTLQSGVLTSVGAITVGQQTAQTMDIKLVAGASGAVAVYFSGTQRISLTGLSHAGFTGASSIKLLGGLGALYWSQVICDTIPHIGDSVKTFPIDALSATNNGWTGGVSDVDEIVYSDATFNFAASNGLVNTYYAAAFSLGTYNIGAVAVGARTRCGVTGPQNLKLALRSNAVNYFSETIALVVGYQACCHTWTTDPNTSAAWTAAHAAAAEGGQESIT